MSTVVRLLIKTHLLFSNSVDNIFELSKILTSLQKSFFSDSQVYFIKSQNKIGIKANPLL